VTYNKKTCFNAKKTFTLIFNINQRTEKVPAF